MPIYVGDVPIGTGGPAGPRGSQWFSGAGAPGVISGQLNGDMYLNETNEDVYQLVAGTWTLQTNIKGAPGTNGTNGTNGVNGTNGTNGTDGVDGLDGDPGPQGVPGVPGPLGSQIIATHPGGTYTVDPTTATDYCIYLEGDIDFEDANFQPGQSCYLRLVQMGGGGHEATFPTDWAGGDDIELSAPADAFDVVIVWQDKLGICVKRVLASTMPVAGFTPDQLADQIGWFQGDSLGEELLDAETLAWGNLYGALTDMTAPDGAGTGPTVRKEGGVKYLEFDGADQWLESDFATEAAPLSIGMVVRINETTSKTPVIGGPGPVGDAEVYVDGSGGTRTWRVNGVNTSITEPTPVWRTVFAHLIASASAPPAGGYVRVDGTQFAGSTGGASLGGIRLAHVEGSNVNFGQIDIAEVIVVGGTLTALERANMEAWLNASRDILNSA